MQKISLFKSLLIVSVTLASLYVALPNFLTNSSFFQNSARLNLGLDLRGGAHLLLSTDFASYLSDQLTMSVNNLRKEFRKSKIGYQNLRVVGNKIVVKLRNTDDISEAKSIIKSFDREAIVEVQGDVINISYSEGKLNRLQDNLIDQSIEIIRLRVDETGTKEPIIQRQGEYNILLQVPGVQDPSELKSVLGKTAKLTFHLVDDSADIEEALRGVVAPNKLLLPSSNPEIPSYLVVDKTPILSGDLLNNAGVSYNQNSQAVVTFELNPIGARIFGDFTRNNKGSRLAIVLDNKFLSAPSINEPIPGGRGEISGNFTTESANELALLLRAGALPAPLKIIEERTVGPSLGADSIESGKLAGIVGFLGVVIFMIWTYGIYGIFATVALVLGLIYIISMLTLFQATLTMPGIAGIVLTIGMAVDANVLIYERIKEEFHKGASLLFSIRKGFESALATIIDSNITTLIAALFLYTFGVGAIKGFAVTLTLGIIATMFSALLVTKILIDIYVKFRKPTKLSF